MFQGTKYAEHAVYDDDWPILCDYWGSPDQGHRAGGRTQGGHPRGQAHFLIVFKIFFDRIKYLYFSQWYFFFHFFFIFFYFRKLDFKFCIQEIGTFLHVDDKIFSLKSLQEKTLSWEFFFSRVIMRQNVFIFFPSHVDLFSLSIL